MADSSFMSRVIVIGFLSSLMFAVLVAQAEDADSETAANLAAAPPNIPDLDYEQNTVYVGMWIIDIYTFEYRGGDFSVDFWAYFFWTDTNITIIDWYLMNGYPVYPSAQYLVDSNMSGQVRFQLWRVRAGLDAGLTGAGYPFDKIKLPIKFELIPHGYPTTLEWIPEITGVDPGLFNPGWKTTGYEITTEIHEDYPIGLPVTQAEFAIMQERAMLAAAVKTILPPLVFCIISALSFLVSVHDDSGFGLRIGLNTSMLITAVLFNTAEVSDIPPVSGFTMFVTFMVSIFMFLSLNMMVTIIGNVDWRLRKNMERVKKINLWGAVICVVVPVVLFASIALFGM